jgi:hypothetical protein
MTRMDTTVASEAGSDCAGGVGVPLLDGERGTIAVHR